LKQQTLAPRPIDQFATIVPNTRYRSTAGDPATIHHYTESILRPPLLCHQLTMSQLPRTQPASLTNAESPRNHRHPTSMPLRQPPNVAASTPRRHHDDDDNNSYRPYYTRRIQILQHLNISASLSRRLYEDAVKTSRHLHNDKRHAISLTAEHFCIAITPSSRRRHLTVVQLVH
jgi:hypothetical protein